MAITIKSAREIELMRESNKRIAEVHKAMEDMIKPGITTWEIDEFAEKMIRGMGCIPNHLRVRANQQIFSPSLQTLTVGGVKNFIFFPFIG